MSVDTCRRKIQYKTKRDAKKQMRVMRREGAYVRPYECPHCRRWHLTSLGVDKAKSPRQSEENDQPELAHEACQDCESGSCNSIE